MEKLFVATVKVISVERIDTLAAASYEISNRFVKLIQWIKILLNISLLIIYN